MDSILRKILIAAPFAMIFYGAIVAFIFFSCAGRTDIPRAWVFFIVNFIYYLAPVVILFKFNPELLIHRMKRKKDSKLWDKILVRVFILIGVYGVIAVAGFDIGRYNWSYLGLRYAVIGYVLYVFSDIITVWAMAVNRHFEPMVRIQKDREHTVVKDGPYKYIRHPGYSGAILWLLSVPLILGSVYAFIPAVVAILLLLLRTYLEDKTLTNELAGYEEYTGEVKYRLIREVW